MKTASRVMYIIGLISNILTLVVAVTGIVLLALAKTNPDIAQQITQNAPQLQQIGMGMLIYLAVVNFIVCFLTFWALRAKAGVFIHILLLIGGIACWDPFFILGGIFGLISVRR